MTQNTQTKKVSNIFQMPTPLKDNNIKRVKSTTADINVSMAQSWLTKNFNRQRGVATAHVNSMAIAMKSNEFFRLDPIKFARIKGFPNTWYLLDGQHTLKAIVKTGITLSSQMIVWIEVPNEIDLGSLYAMIDTHKGRTPSQQYKALDLKGLATLNGVSTAIANKTTAATQMIYRDFKHKGSNKVDVKKNLPYVAYYLEAAKKIDRLFNNPTATQEDLYSNLQHKGAWSILLVIMEEQEQKATDFLIELLRVANLGRKDLKKELVVGKPAAKLYEMLRTEQKNLLCRGNEIFSVFGAGMDQARRYNIVVSYYWSKYFYNTASMNFRPSKKLKSVVQIAGTRWAQNADNKIIVDPVKCVQIDGYLVLPKQ